MEFGGRDKKILIIFAKRWNQASQWLEYFFFIARQGGCDAHENQKDGSAF